MKNFIISFFTIFYLLLFSFKIFSQQINLSKGWNLCGTYIDTVSLPENLSDSSVVSTLWIWKDNKWGIFTENTSVKSLLEQYNIPFIASIKSGTGFWINSSCSQDCLLTLDGTITDGKILNLPKGWNLVSIKTDKTVNISIFKKDNIKSVWQWQNKKWKIYLSENQSILQQYGIETIENISPNEGIWVFVSNSSVEISFGNEGEDNEDNNNDLVWTNYNNLFYYNSSGELYLFNVQTKQTELIASNIENSNNEYDSSVEVILKKIDNNSQYMLGYYSLIFAKNGKIIEQFVDNLSTKQISSLSDVTKIIPVETYPVVKKPENSATFALTGTGAKLAFLYMNENSEAIDETGKKIIQVVYSSDSLGIIGWLSYNVSEKMFEYCSYDLGNCNSLLFVDTPDNISTIQGNFCGDDYFYFINNEIYYFNSTNQTLHKINGLKFQGNYMGNGIVATSNKNYLFVVDYIASDNTCKIYKINLSNYSFTNISSVNGKISTIAVNGDNLYYTVENELFSMSTNGENIETLYTNTGVSFAYIYILFVKNNFIYFSSYSNEFKNIIHKMELLGNNHQEITVNSFFFTFPFWMEEGCESWKTGTRLVVVTDSNEIKSCDIENCDFTNIKQIGTLPDTVTTCWLNELNGYNFLISCNNGDNNTDIFYGNSNIENSFLQVTNTPDIKEYIIQGGI